jgi:hypothetical protein
LDGVAAHGLDLGREGQHRQQAVCDDPLAGHLTLAGGAGALLLYGVSPVDPWTFAGIACLLTAVVTLGCWIPARRAARANPVQALRYE